MSKVFIPSICVIVLLSACSLFSRQEATEAPGEKLLSMSAESTDTPLPTDTISPTKTEKPTSTPEPDTNTTPTLTPLPEGIIFRDDFEGYFQPGWEWKDEDPEKWSFVENEMGKFLQIITDNPSIFKNGYQVNSLVRDLPEGDFAITAHIIAEPDENFQQANIYLFEDDANFVLLNFGYCGPCFPSFGTGFFMETKVSTNPLGDTYMLPRNQEDTEIYLRLVNEGGTITGYFATKPDEWNRIAQIANSFDFETIGLGTTNSLALNMKPSKNLITHFDYFEISEPPPVTP